VLEKAAANVSVIRGVLSPERARAMSSRGREEVDASGGQPYSAVAMSLVFHSATPFVPTLRADVRLFEVSYFCTPGGSLSPLALLTVVPLNSTPNSEGFWAYEPEIVR
jgi:coproporphyrinogen III oxidase